MHVRIGVVVRRAPPRGQPEMFCLFRGQRSIDSPALHFGEQRLPAAAGLALPHQHSVVRDERERPRIRTEYRASYRRSANGLRQYRDPLAARHPPDARPYLADAEQQAVVSTERQTHDWFIVTAQDAV